MPASISPVPAVASHDEAGGAIQVWPSGAATTVSAPLYTTMLLMAAGACRARSSLLPSKEPKRRVNSPSCGRSEEHTSELQSLMRISDAVFCLKKKNNTIQLIRHKL